MSRSRERIWLSRQYLCVDDEQAPERHAAAGQAAVAIVAQADFEDAFREYFAPVYRFIARRVGSARAEDLAAEVFATAYRRLASYEPSRGSLRSWLYGIAANVVRGHWREEQQLLELDARLAPATQASADTGAFADAADERVTAASLAPRIAGALAALNPDQREVLLLHAWLSHEEIAAALSIAPGTARSRLSRARAALRAHLGEFDFDLWTFKEQRSRLTRSTCCGCSGPTRRDRTRPPGKPARSAITAVAETAAEETAPGETVTKEPVGPAGRDRMTRRDRWWRRPQHRVGIISGATLAAGIAAGIVSGLIQGPPTLSGPLVTAWQPARRRHPPRPASKCRRAAGGSSATWSRTAGRRAPPDLNLATSPVRPPRPATSRATTRPRRAARRT